MSLGDELRYLRAKTGGPTPLEISEATGVDAGYYCQIEQRYREMGDDDTIENLAVFFRSDADVLKRARSRSRKALSQHLENAKTLGTPIPLHLRTGETLTGRIVG